MSIKTSIKTSVVTVQMGGKRQRSVRKRQTAGECLMGKWNGAAVTGYEPQVSFGDYKKRLCVLSSSRRRYEYANTRCIGLRWVLLDKRSNV